MRAGVNWSIASSTTAENGFQLTLVVFQPALRLDAEAACSSYLMVVVMETLPETSTNK